MQNCIKTNFILYFYIKIFVAKLFSFHKKEIKKILKHFRSFFEKENENKIFNKKNKNITLDLLQTTGNFCHPLWVCLTDSDGSPIKEKIFLFCNLEVFLHIIFFMQKSFATPTPQQIIYVIVVCVKIIEKALFNLAVIFVVSLIIYSQNSNKNTRSVV